MQPEFPLMGTETEYGLSVEDKGPEHLAEETAALLRALPQQHCTAWDYSAESPLKDVRGFVAAGLQRDPEDAKFDQQGRPPADSAVVKVDRILTNGARLYADHGHPEYSTPECAAIKDMLAHDRAGELILSKCIAARREHDRDGAVRLYKNNTDFHGFSYGTHENYLVARPPAPESFLRDLLPFLVTRQIFAGAGKVGLEEEAAPQEGFFYQLSQRADHFYTLMGVDTLYRRPLINTRDEPHASAAGHMRLHVIIGDANRSQFAQALKMGTTALVLMLLREGWQPPVVLADAVSANKAISRDQALRWPVELEGGRQMGAVEIQAQFCRAAAQELAGASAEIDWILKNWEETLAALEGDPLQLSDRLDWAAKLMLLQAYMEETRRSDLILLQSLDLEYHNIDPAESLFAPLEESGQMLQIISPAEIERATIHPPANTRAFVRGEAIRRFAAHISSISWQKINLDGSHIDLGGMVEGSLETLNEQLAQSHSVKSFAEVIRRWKSDHV